MINDVDLFVFMDDVQFTVRDWRNRNLIKTKQGSLWLTVPVGSKRNRLIQDVVINQSIWQKEHHTNLIRHYCKTPYFKYVEPLLDLIYTERKWTSLSEMNQYLIKEIAQQYLNIRTDFMNADSLNISGKKTERLIAICEATGITHYLSGPAAKDYIDPLLFEDAGIKLEFKDYNDYPEYQQLYPPFTHHVSILDLLVHTGPDAPSYIWGLRDKLTQEHGQ